MKFAWHDRIERIRQLDDYIAKNKKARFGSEILPESEKANRVRRHFNEVAPKYDLMNTLLSMGIHYLWKYKAIRMMGLKPGHTVLDMCGGTGDLSVMAKKIAGPKTKVFLCDINREMMKAGRKKSTNHRYRKKITYIQGDAEAIPFRDNFFDAVMVGFAIRNITHMKQSFKEMQRVLKPGGRFMCLEFSKPVCPWFRVLYDFYSFHIMPALGGFITGSKTAYTCLPETIRLFLMPDELAKILEEAGFRNVKYKLLTNGIAVVHLGEK